MSLQFFESQKRKFVVGLFWQAISDPKNIKAEVKTIAQKLQQDFYITRDSGVPQVGLASSQEGADSSCYSLAAIASDAIDKMGVNRSWLCAVELPDGNYAYFASRDNAFLPDGDLFGSKEEVLEKMSQDYSIGSWDKLYAPNEFGFPGAQEVTFEMLTTAKGKRTVNYKYQIKSVKEQSNLHKIAGALALAGLLIFGAKYYVDYQEQKELERIQILAEEAIKRDQALKEAVERDARSKIPKPWEAVASAPQFVRECTNQLSPLSMKPGGWLLIEFNCNGTSVDYKWERGLTPISYLYHEFPNAMVDINGVHAGLNKPLEISFIREREKLEVGNYAVFNLISDAQSIGLDLKISEIPFIAPTNLPPDSPVPVAEWKTYSFSFNSKQNPSQYVGALNRAGLRITNLSYKPFEAGTSWVVSGMYYSSIN